MKIYNPAPGRPITSPYGMRKHPITHNWKKHHGIDYGGSFNVLAAQDGIVKHIGWSPRGGGHVVIIKHASNLYTVYYHGAHKTPLKKGDRVMAGDFVYRSGTTGNSTGNHLHFETRTSRLWGTTKDPQIYLTGSVPDTDNNQDSYKVSIKVDGRLGRNTWKAWQTALKAGHGFRGIIDGRPGKMTWTAIQESTGKHYTGKIDGIPGPLTRKAVQAHLKDLGYYTMSIDGIWGRGTISALQRSLNEAAY